VKNLEDIIEEVLPHEVDSVVKYLSSLKFNEINSKYYMGLDNAISSIMILNKFDKVTQEKLENLLDSIRHKLSGK